jgi:predicted regulator of Ras-like GTPase activity (Roadblock/LC7/MglB family)
VHPNHADASLIENFTVRHADANAGGAEAPPAFMSNGSHAVQAIDDFAQRGRVGGGRISSGGYVAIYAVGTAAVLVLIGDEGLDITRLHRESRSVVDNIEKLLA